MTKVWGNACWQLFHVTAVNLKETDSHLIPEIVNIISLICNNLPCPYCTKHANETLSRVKKNQINTKEKLIYFLWKFHNIVNQNNKKDIFTRENHDLLYKNKNLKDIVRKWTNIMNHIWKGGDYHQMMHTMSRQNMVRRVALFYKNNIDAFTQY